jgi:hypothetical protein
MDKRDIGQIFRDRLAALAGRYDGNLSAFARAIGLDRSALSQFMVEGSTRLPRAETLCRIAAVHSVTLDWLLGLSSSDTLGAEMVPAGEIEEPLAGTPDTQLSRWHRAAIGYKIRYVPKRIPDLLRLDDAALYEFSSPQQQADPETKIAEAHEQLAYTRRPETDMEVCMPRQTVELLAAGQGEWSGLPLSLRRQQLRHMAALQRVSRRALSGHQLNRSRAGSDAAFRQSDPPGRHRPRSQRRIHRQAGSGGVAAPSNDHEFVKSALRQYARTGSARAYLFQDVWLRIGGQDSSSLVQ